MWLIVNATIVLLVAILFAIGTVKNYHLHRKLSYISFTLSFLFFVEFIVQLFWIIGIYEYNFTDLLTLTCLIIILQAFLFYFLVRLFKKNILTNVIFFMYLVSLALVFLSPLNYRIFAILLSFFFMLLILLNFIDSNNSNIKNAGYFSLIYSGISAVLFFLPLLGVNQLEMFISVSNFFLLFAAYRLASHIDEPKNNFKDNKDSILLIFMKYFIFILAFTNLVLIGTLGLHEFSHVLTARYYDCDARAIFFEKGIYPYSEINCVNIEGKDNITLAGPVFPVLLAIILLFVGNPITQSISFLAIGFNLIAGYKDFIELGISESIVLVFMLFGLFLLLIGVLYLARFILRKESHQNIF